ncbi:cytochrome P450 2A13-like isoform X3 [Denticeps clupeoides]|uniref:cytochrome P450 2A13-like isoform X3 n=1 Tax=Denticeps clupeoides TaxID=299321 RepID=UPI0010A39F89|nr:cytochrome P450 2A13-like isoform X3 [Denticeps clupeoides]
MDVSSTLVLASLVLLLLLVFGMRKGKQGLRLPPGPTGLPLLGNLPQLNKHAPFKSFLEWSKQYGPVITVYLGLQRVVVLIGYETVKEALVDQAEDFSGRAPVPFLYKATRGYGLLISNGERWHQLRRFTLTTLRDFGMGRKKMEIWIQEESKYLVDLLRENKSASFDPSFFLSRAVSNVICALVFGQRFSYKDAQLLRLLQTISGILKFLSSPSGQLYNIFPRLMNYLPGRHQTIFREVDEIRNFCTEKITQHQETLNPDDPRDYIDCFLMRLNEEKNLPSTEFHNDNLISTVLNLFLAEKMQKEIDDVIGQTRSPTMEDRKSLPFTNAVIHEAQRFLDLVPMGLPHYATKDISFKGFIIPKDTVILPLLHSVLKGEDHWDNPWTFNPDHFLDNNGNFKPNPAFIPFASGKRACVGESLARMELFLFLVTLLQHFTFSSPEGPDSVDISPENSGFGNVPRRYEMIVTPR